MTLIQQLREAGVDVRDVATAAGARSARDVDALLDVSVDGRSVRFAVEERARAPYPAEVEELAHRRRQIESVGTPLLVAPFVSESLGRRLVATGWSWADEVGDFDLRAKGVRLRQRLTSKAPSPKRQSLPRGSGGWAVMRWLILNGDVTSLTEVARDAQVTQPRVSQVAHQLEQLGLLSRLSRANWTANREELLDRFLMEYPGPGGSEAYLYSLDEPLEVVLRVLSRTPKPSIVVSADVGADLLAPWRRPTSVVLYTEAPLDLERALSATQAHGAGDANIIQRVPADRSVFALGTTVEVRSVRVPLADPVQTLWDLHALGGDDRLEAAQKLREWLLNSRSKT
jgi:hypothetical protein